MPGDLLAQDGLVEEGAEAVGLVGGRHVHQRDGDGGREELAHTQRGGNNGWQEEINIRIFVKQNNIIELYVIK